MGAPQPEMFIGYHTSTPVASTHIFHFRLGEGGEIVSQDGGTVVEAFEVNDTYPVNASRTLLAFPVHCPVGFCVGGAGVSFVNMQSAEVYPRFSAGDLGLKPSFVLFL